jgi:hypothetical protein
VVLEPLGNVSELVAEATRNPENARFQTGGVTTEDWYERRVKKMLISNRKVCRIIRDDAEYSLNGQGPETWKESRGTEHTVSAY